MSEMREGGTVTGVRLTAVRTVKHDGRFIGRIRADWSGGPYIELTVWPYEDGAIPHQPTEVVNVWDYERREPTIPFAQSHLAAALDDWIEEWNREDPSRSWLESYLDNA